MKLFHPLVTALCFIFLPYVAAAQGSAEGSKTDTVNQIFEEIPVEGTLNEAAQEMHAQLSQNPFRLPSLRNERMVKLFAEAFAADSLLAYARKAFHQQYDPAYADSVLQWIDTKNTQHVLEAEQEFYTLQGIRKRVVRKYELEQNPPSQSRIELIQSVARNRSTGESEVESQSIIYRAIISAFGKLSDQQAFTESQIDGIVSNYRSQIRPQVDQSVINQLLLMYHGLQNDTLKKYRAFYETGSGKWLSSATSGSIHAAYQTAADRLLKSIDNQ